MSYSEKNSKILSILSVYSDLIRNITICQTLISSPKHYNCCCFYATIWYHESCRAEILREYSPTDTGHMPGVMCHLSRVRCRLSSVKCQVSGVIFFFIDELGQLVGGGFVINGAYPI